MKKYILKTLKMALCVLFIFSFALNIPHAASAAPTDSSGISYKQEYFYHWTKVVGNDNVADFLGKDANNPKPVIIVDTTGADKMLSPNGSAVLDDANEISYISAKNTWALTFFNKDGDFITSDAKESFFAKYAGMGGHNAPKYYLLYPSASSMNPTGKPYMEAGTRVLSGNSNDRDTYLDVQNVNSNSRKEAWSITNNQGTNQVPSGQVKIFNIMDGITNDQWMAYYPTYNDGSFGSRFWNAGGKWSALDNFTMYVGNKIVYAAINWDHTVQSGQVLTSKDNIMVTNGASITVEKGAVLSVSGQLFNNGTIINHGTIVLQDNSCINSLEGKGGSIINDGGDIVMLKGSKLYFDRKAKLTLKNGSTLVNAGALVVQNNFEITDSTLDIRENGSVHLGYYIGASKLSQLKNVPVKKSRTYYNLNDDRSGEQPTFDGLYSGYIAYYNGLTSSEAKRIATSESMIIGKNVEIINSGFLEINYLIVGLDDDVHYTSRKNGRFVQTDDSRRLVAQVESALNGNGYWSDSWKSQQDKNIANKKFWVKCNFN